MFLYRTDLFDLPQGFAKRRHLFIKIRDIQICSLIDYF
jgi:hypothetical protein